MNFLNFLIVKMLVKIKFANIINIINNKEIIPELIQKECNAKEIYNSVDCLLSSPHSAKELAEKGARNGDLWNPLGSFWAIWDLIWKTWAAK